MEKLKNGYYNLKMKLRVITNESKVFTATLENNATVAAFIEMLPLTLDMSDFNANEKKFDLPKRMPTKDANPQMIQAGGGKGCCGLRRCLEVHGAGLAA